MRKIKNFEIFQNPDFEAGCTNGNYNTVSVEFDNGEVVEGPSCRCGNGCAGTWSTRLIEEWMQSGEEFRDLDDFFQALG